MLKNFRVFIPLDKRKNEVGTNYTIVADEHIQRGIVSLLLSPQGKRILFLRIQTCRYMTTTTKATSIYLYMAIVWMHSDVSVIGNLINGNDKETNKQRIYLFISSGRRILNFATRWTYTLISLVLNTCVWKKVLSIMMLCVSAYRISCNSIWARILYSAVTNALT